jgi:hypothetical protein
VRVRFKRNEAGFNALRTSPVYKAMLKGHADRIESAANAIPSTTTPAATEPYYETYDASDERRSRYRIATANLRAQRHEARTFALNRALSSDG